MQSVPQKAACGDADTCETFTNEAEQEERLQFIARLADAIIRTQLLNDTATAQFLVDQLPDDPHVQLADLDPQCNNV